MEILRGTDPFDLFQEWLEAARKSELNDAESMALATVNAQGRPAVRMVLLKNIDRTGFVFFTNMDSRKSSDISENSNVALCFHWKSLLRQVRVEGRAEQASAAEADAYFATRHPQSQLGAWASTQSQPLESRAVLEARVESFRDKFSGAEVPRPPNWAGWRIVPDRIEFWQQGDARLHDRFLFTRNQDNVWDLMRLYP